MLTNVPPCVSSAHIEQNQQPTVPRTRGGVSSCMQHPQRLWKSLWETGCDER
jgi:hypothetical protein